jgi:mevalonate kinase
VKVIAAKKYILSNGKLFSRKSSGLDPLNSYLSIPILINSKIILATGIPNQTLDGKGAVFLLDSGIVGETPYGHYLHGKPKRQRLPYDAEKSVRKIY